MRIIFSPREFEKWCPTIKFRQYLYVHNNKFVSINGNAKLQVYQDHCYDKNVIFHWIVKFMTLNAMSPRSPLLFSHNYWNSLTISAYIQHYIFYKPDYISVKCLQFAQQFYFTDVLNYYYKPVIFFTRCIAIIKDFTISQFK